MTSAVVLARFEPLRIGLAQTLATAGIEVLGQAATVDELMRRTTRGPADVQVVELRTLELELDALRRTEDWLRHQRIVFLATMQSASPLTLEALQLLTVPRSVALVSVDSVARLIETVELVASGMFVCEMEAMRPLFSRLSLLAPNESNTDLPGTEQLSPRELEVLSLVAEGIDNRQIAEHMVVSEGTVKAHVSHILAKLSIDTRPALVRYALTHEIFPSPPAEDQTAGDHSVRARRRITVRFTAKATPLQTRDEAGPMAPE
jgi:DNA-binding NarL/FixJ family response regulator